jgi:hypothetical protein
MSWLLALLSGTLAICVVTGGRGLSAYWIGCHRQ